MGYYQPKSPVYLTLFEDQVNFANSVFTDNYLTYVFAGSIRAGKTICIMTIILLYCRIFPGSKWVVIRRSRSDLIRTTLATFQHYVLPPNVPCEFNKQYLTYEFPQWGNSQILFMEESFDTDKDFGRFRGLEANGFFLSQAEELQEQLYYTCIQRAGQWRTDPMAPTMILVDLNPTDRWPRTLWYKPWCEGTLPESTYYQQADIFKNPFITKEYLDNLKTMMPSKVYSRFLLKKWGAIVGGVLQSEWFKVKKMATQPSQGVRYWDLAVTTHTSSDFSAGALCTNEDNRFQICHIKVGKWLYPDLRNIIIQTAISDGTDVTIGIEQAGQQQAIINDLQTLPELGQYTIRGCKPEGDKFNRAMVWAARAEQGLIDVHEGVWNKDFFDQVNGFTANDSHEHDDMLDAVSGAYAMLADNQAPHCWSFKDEPKEVVNV